MSDMEIYYGKYKKSDITFTTEDLEDLYEFGENRGVNLIHVNGILYEFSKIEEVNQFGSLNIFQIGKNGGS